MNYKTLLSKEINSAWHWLSHFLEDVEKTYPGWTATEVRLALIAKEAQCWVVENEGRPTGIVITKLGKIGDTPSGFIWIAAGKPLEAGLGLFKDHIEPWFKSKGCKIIEICGRRGWGKVLPDYREAGTIFVKELA